MESKMKFMFMFLMVISSKHSFAQYSSNVVASITKMNWFYNPEFENFKQERAKAVMQDNELEHQEVGQNEDFNSNPIMLNGKFLDYGLFNLNTKGMLTVVKGNTYVPISFYVSIRRNGKILNDNKMLFLNRPLYKINLSNLFPFCKEGDLLILNPVNVENWKAKRILKLISEGC